MFIGNRLKELRKSKNITLSELAQTSGVQIATLSRIENQKMVGTLDSHLRVARALGIDITELYSNIEHAPEASTVKSLHEETDVFLHNDLSSFQVLTSNLLKKKMMPVILKLDAGGKSHKEENPAGSEKFIFVLEGKIDVVIEEKAYSLGRHHSLYIDASRAHYCVNTGKSTAKVICVTTPVAL